MENQMLIDRLSSQIESYQEGYKILAKSGSLKELTLQFHQLLKTNLSMGDVNVFYRNPAEPDWQQLVISNSKSLSYLAQLSTGNHFQITYLPVPEFQIRVILPLIDNSTFGILLGPKLDGSAYTDFDKISLQIFIQMLASAYQSFRSWQKEKELVFSINQKVLQLNNLVDTGIELSNLEKQKSLFSLALERVISITNASKGMVNIVKKGSAGKKIFFPVKFKLVAGDSFIESHFEYKNEKYSFLLVNKESRAGFVPFDETDQLLLNALSRQVHAALENNDLHQQALEKQKIEQEISVAGSIQRAILPRTIPRIENYDLYGINFPSKEIGGDYYDYIRMEDNRYAFIIADVAGKGIAAALLVSSLHAFLQAYLPQKLSLKELTNRLNKAIFDASTTDKYITFFVAILHPVTGELECLNAGHNPMYIIKSDLSLYQIKAAGIPLGMMELDFPYQSEQLQLDKGDRLFLYTDGITEAMNKKGKFYEDSGRLEKFIADQKTSSAREFIEQLVSDIKKFCGDAVQSDDITALYLIRK